MSSPPSIVVAGAGAIGRTVAYFLARAGYSVTVVDPDPAGGLASRIAAGMLAPAFETLFDEGGRFELLAAARDLWRPLARELGLPVAWEGGMAIGTLAQAQAWVEALSAMGAEPELRDLGGGHWGAYSDADRQIDPELALSLLQREAERAGATYLAGRVTGFAGGDVEIEGGPSIPADRLVIATGAGHGLTALAPELAALAPVKGHILRAPGGFIGIPAIRAPGLYLCRTEQGVILGATMEPGIDDPAVDPTVVAGLLAAGAQLAGGLERLTWTAAAGVRAATPDGLPMAGVGGAPGVILAVGARRNGWLLAPTIAEVVLDAVAGRPRGAIGQLFDPRRFA